MPMVKPRSLKLQEFRGMALPVVPAGAPFVLRDWDAADGVAERRRLSLLLNQSDMSAAETEAVLARAMYSTAFVAFACKPGAPKLPVGAVVCERTGELVKETGMLDLTTSYVNVLWIYVQPRHRMMGVGKRLLECAFVFSYHVREALMCTLPWHAELQPYLARLEFTPPPRKKNGELLRPLHGGFGWGRMLGMPPNAAVSVTVPQCIASGEVRLRLATPEDRKDWNALILDGVNHSMGGSDMLDITLRAELRLVAEVVTATPNSASAAAAATTPTPGGGGKDENDEEEEEEEETRGFDKVRLVGVIAMSATGWIPFVGCTRAYRNQGMGSFLLAAACEWWRLAAPLLPDAPDTYQFPKCADPDIKPDDAWPTASLSPMNRRLVPFYERRGFVFVHGPLVSSHVFEEQKILMQRPLNPVWCMMPADEDDVVRPLSHYVPELAEDIMLPITRRQAKPADAAHGPIPALERLTNDLIDTIKRGRRNRRAAATAVRPEPPEAIRGPRPEAVSPPPQKEENRWEPEDPRTAPAPAESSAVTDPPPAMVMSPSTLALLATLRRGPPGDANKGTTPAAATQA